MLTGRTVLDTTRALYVWEWPNYPQYYVPLTDVDASLLLAERQPQRLKRGTAYRHGLRVGKTTRPGAARVYRDDAAPGLAGTVRFEWNALDAWYEEDEQVFVHPRNPYVRVDGPPGSGGRSCRSRPAQSTDGGATWTRPARVNDNASPAATDQFQPSVAEGPGGAVAVAFYDRRGTCPAGLSVLPADVGRANFCIDVSVQTYRDSGRGARPVGANVRASAFTWDPQNPAQHVGGLGQMACASHDDPCSLAFIGDYFGLTVSAGNVYVMSVSTHYPSPVIADEGGPVYYQQQVLSTLSRTALGIA
jgi:uncharacterized protein (DUF427 family)